MYIRVWDDDDDATFIFDICVYPTSNDSDILPGLTTINCTDPALNFYDSGGSASNYSNSETNTYEICPDTPGQVVSVTFSMVDLQALDASERLDHIIVLNGTDGTSQIIADIDAFTLAGTTITSTHPDGCLTFIFMSSGTLNNYDGWAATVDCVTPDPANDVLNHLTATCGEQNCLGGCLRTLCGIPAEVTFQGDGFANQELNESVNGCWAIPERCSNWFYINPLAAGDLFS